MLPERREVGESGGEATGGIGESEGIVWSDSPMALGWSEAIFVRCSPFGWWFEECRYVTLTFVSDSSMPLTIRVRRLVSKVEISGSEFCHFKTTVRSYHRYSNQSLHIVCCDLADERREGRICILRP